MDNVYTEGGFVLGEGSEEEGGRERLAIRGPELTGAGRIKRAGDQKGRFLGFGKVKRRAVPLRPPAKTAPNSHTNRYYVAFHGYKPRVFPHYVIKPSTSTLDWTPK